ncbi:MFS transporter [Confluentibacter flavum]|uniref:Major facilitator superfamily (MFS) profile domain-containing protein n=1 Tax=Confluentibacter flavum TaxID=1909700 RepID=A0A2N3HKB0_9FLAO|nr:MFS transporter [Confluentibacter flavum]PKQ45387.1 hypothetical protein CSW08_08470 [Confluentibacter flavum]
MKRQLLLIVILVEVLYACIISTNILLIPFIIKNSTPIFHPYNISIKLVIGIILISIMIGVLIIIYFCDKFGRQKTLRSIIGILFVFTILSSIVSDWWPFLFFRFINWVLIGSIFVVTPILIAEICNSNIRGGLISFNQFLIILAFFFGIQFNYIFSNNFLEISNSLTWIETGLILALYITTYKIPESPRWLSIKGKKSEVINNLNKIRVKSSKTEAKLISNHLISTQSTENTQLLSNSNNKPLKILLTLISFYQLSGIGVIIYYTPLIFEISSIQNKSWSTQFIYIGLTVLLFTFLSMILVDILGRRIQLMIGSLGMMFFLAMLSKSFYLENFLELAGLGVIIYLLGFIASFSYSIGTVIWILISEIFPIRFRAKGQAFGSLCYLILIYINFFLIPFFLKTPKINEGGLLFAFSSLSMIGLFIYSIKKIPITERKNLEAIQINLNKSH